MKRRPPLLGYNHNVRHDGRLYHVQTEDSGPLRPHITTHVFVRGTILFTIRATYDPESADDVVLRLMQSQHKIALRQLRDGAFDEKAAALDVALPEAATSEVSPIQKLALERLDAPGALVATTEPYNSTMAELEKISSTSPSLSPLTDAELAELVDLATGSLDAVGPTQSAGAYLSDDTEEEPERILELEAEPPGEDELLQLQQATEEPSSSQRTPSQTALYASTRSPRRIAVWAPSGGYMARQRYSSPPAPPAPAAEQPPPLSDLPSEPTRIRLSPSGRPVPAGRPAGRAARTTARRLDPGPFRPRPTAEGVVVQRPLIVTDQGVFNPEDRPSTTDPRHPSLAADERSLDQVILAYLAEDPGKKK